MITMLAPLLEVEVIFSRLDTPVNTASSGREMERSTSSGPAPVYEVYTTRIGGLISGYRSIGRFTSAKKPAR